jgi:hypothetical protein
MLLLLHQEDGCQVFRILSDEISQLLQSSLPPLSRHLRSSRPVFGETPQTLHDLLNYLSAICRANGLHGRTSNFTIDTPPILSTHRHLSSETRQLTSTRVYISKHTQMHITRAHSRFSNNHTTLVYPFSDLLRLLLFHIFDFQCFSVHTVWLGWTGLVR